MKVNSSTLLIFDTNKSFPVNITVWRVSHLFGFLCLRILKCSISWLAVVFVIEWVNINRKCVKGFNKVRSECLSCDGISSICWTHSLSSISVSFVQFPNRKKRETIAIAVKAFFELYFLFLYLKTHFIALPQIHWQACILNFVFISLFFLT